MRIFFCLPTLHNPRLFIVLAKSGRADGILDEISVNLIAMQSACFLQATGEIEGSVEGLNGTWDSPIGCFVVFAQLPSQPEAAPAPKHMRRAGGVILARHRQILR
jgi:hypothetical protein